MRIRQLYLLALPFLSTTSTTAVAHDVVVVESADGPYADFIEVGKPFGQAVSPLLNRRALDDGRRVKLRVERAEDGLVVHTETAPGEGLKRISGRLYGNSAGPRYAGDAVFGAGVEIAARGLRWRLDAAKGASTTDNSAGGRYDQVVLGVERTEPWGVVGLTLSRTRYAQGGPFSMLDIDGSLDRFALTWRRPLRGGEVHASLGRVLQATDLAAVAWRDRVSYSLASVGARFRGALGEARYTVGADLALGFAGSRSTRGGAMLGLYRGDLFARVAVDGTVAGDLPRGFGWRLAAGVRATDRTAPPDEWAYIGGAGRGLAYLPGEAAGPSGAWASATLYGPRLTHADLVARPWFLFDAGRVSPVVGDDVAVRSLGVGFDLVLGRQVTATAGFARDPVTHGHRWVLSFNASF